MKIYDDLFDVESQQLLEDLFFSSNFDWYLNAATIAQQDLMLDSKTTDSPQFTHRFVDNDNIYSKFWDNIKPIIKVILVKENLRLTYIDRVKANMSSVNSQYPDGHHLPVHIDAVSGGSDKSFTLIYYVNDADGDTLFFKQRKNNTEDFEQISKVSPKRGRIVLFPTNTLHAGQPPKNTQYRCVLNVCIRAVDF